MATITTFVKTTVVKEAYQKFHTEMALGHLYQSIGTFGVRVAL
jgi:hypothetical protein